MVAEEKMSSIPEKVLKILKLAVPTTKKHVRAVPGLLGHCCRFVASFITSDGSMMLKLKEERPSHPSCIMLNVTRRGQHWRLYDAEFLNRRQTPLVLC